MANYSIKDLERLSGIKAHTIRIWEKRYGLIEPERTSTNIRTYCDAELKKLLNISLLNRNGIKISKIAKLSPDEINATINQVVDKEDNAEGKIEELTVAMIEYDEDRFEKILAKTIIQLGFEDTVIKVLYPFFSRIGLMWQTGAITVTQEHFISNLVKQKLYVAIDNQIVGYKEKTKTFVLFLPENEWHEIGLLFFYYLTKKRNHKVIYLGQSVPQVDLLQVMGSNHIDYFVTSIVASTNNTEILEYMQPVIDATNPNKVIVSGYYAQKIDWPQKNVLKVESPIEFVDFLDSI